MPIKQGVIMEKRAVSTESFIEVNYGDQIKDYNGNKWIFAGVQGKEVVVIKNGSNDINGLKLMYPSIFDLILM
jgi:hypothetical protein